MTRKVFKLDKTKRQAIELREGMIVKLAAVEDEPEQLGYIMDLGRRDLAIVQLDSRCHDANDDGIREVPLDQITPVELPVKQVRQRQGRIIQWFVCRTCGATQTSATTRHPGNSPRPTEFFCEECQEWSPVTEIKEPSER